MTQLAAAQTPNAATDTRIDPQVRTFLAELNKDSSPFWELPQPKPQEILTGLQGKTPVDLSGVTAVERTITQDGRTRKAVHHDATAGYKSRSLRAGRVEGHAHAWRTGQVTESRKHVDTSSLPRGRDWRIKGTQS